MSEHTDAARLEAARDAMRTAPTPERRVGEADVFVPRMPSSVVQDEINYCAYKLDRTFRDEVDLRTYLYICQDWRDLRAANTRLTAEVERLKWEAVVWKSSLECWGRHHPWCWMVTQAGVEGVYCNCGYREALTGKDRSHEITPLSPHDAEQVRLFEERVRASITPETEEAARRFVAARDAFAASGGALPTPAPEAKE